MYEQYGGDSDKVPNANQQPAVPLKNIDGEASSIHYAQWHAHIHDKPTYSLPCSLRE